MNIEEMKKKLLAEKSRLEQQLREYRAEDPFLADDRDAEVHSFDTDTTESEAHDRIESTRNSLKVSLSEVLLSLQKIEEGTYGKCEKCGKDIDPGRLEAEPTARFCMACAT